MGGVAKEKIKREYKLKLTMDLYVVIVAGGSGKRMGAEIPKQFLELAGRPVLMHTIERFKAFNDSIEIITVLPENQLRFWLGSSEKTFILSSCIHWLKADPNRFYFRKERTGICEESGTGGHSRRSKTICKPRYN